MNKKKLIVVIIFLIISIAIGIFIFYEKTHTKQAEEVSSKIDEPDNVTTGETKIEEIIIYDIEEGYLTVPYNNLAEKHEYNFDKYLKNEIR